MSTGVVTFDPAAWKAQYTLFANVTDAQAQGWFDDATLIFANNTQNPAWSACVLKPLLYLLTAHIAFLEAPRDGNGVPAATGQPASPIVGRINSASEGSVSVGAEWSGKGGPTQDWYLQSTYGARFWASTAQFRTFQYAAQPTVVIPAIFPYVGGPYGFTRRR